jgi:iron-sulfur cluster assembly protein
MDATLMQATEQGTPEHLTFSEAGARKAAELIKKSGKENAAIRVYVKSGGCSGYSYGMAIDDRALEGDQLIEDQGVKMLVDKMSWPLLKGSQVDYVENMMGGGFNVVNPNATSSCGCGHSFRTDGKQAPAGESPTCQKRSFHHHTPETPCQDRGFRGHGSASTSRIFSATPVRFVSTFLLGILPFTT